MTLRTEDAFELAVGNCMDVTAARRLDPDCDGFIELDALAAHAQTIGRQRPRNAEEAYQLLGGARHELTVYPSPDWRGPYGKSLWIDEKPLYHGDYHVEGLGAGVARTRLEYFYPSGYEQPPVTGVLFAFDCDMFAPEFVDRLAAAELVIFGGRWVPEIADHEYLAIPMKLFTAPAESGTFNGKPYTLLPEKILTVTVDLRDLVTFVGADDAHFYARLLMKDRQSHEIWNEGVEGNTFDLVFAAYPGGEAAVAAERRVRPKFDS